MIEIRRLSITMIRKKVASTKNPHVSKRFSSPKVVVSNSPKISS
jgi:hypothetical protein